MKTIVEDIKNASFHPVYLLYGEEEYLKKLYKEKLLRALNPDDDTMNFTRYEGKGLKEEEILSMADTIPFFADRRIILLENSGFFKNKTESLPDYLENLPDYLVLICVEQEVDKRNRMYKAVAKHGHVAEFAKQTEEALVRWILGILKRENKKITQRDMEHFLSKAGNDMGTLDRELEKLLSYTMEREVITTADIDAVCSERVENQIFAMVRAMGSGRKKQALDYYYDLLALKEPPMRILFLMAREFNLILQCKLLKGEGLDQKAIASKAGIAPFAAKNYLGLIGKYSTETLISIVEDFVQTETDVKTGRLTDVLSVELMLTKYSA